MQSFFPVSNSPAIQVTNGENLPNAQSCNNHAVPTLVKILQNTLKILIDALEKGKANSLNYFFVILEAMTVSITPKDTEKSIEKKHILRILKQSIIIDICAPIKQIAISLRRKYALKISDLLIADTSIYLDLSLVSEDVTFANIKDLNRTHYKL